MKIARTLLALSTLVGLSLGATTAGLSADESGTHQCFRRFSDPPLACSACAETCRGPGYVCCNIVVT